jgi:hypothetical protein
VSFGAQECSPVAASPDVSVVIPLNDARGDATDHLRTWTHGQTHPRSRYEVVIVSDGEEPDVDREIAALLQPHDRFEVAAGALLIELWNRAAELASSDWLLFTENHVHARPDCLEKALAGIEADPDLEAASIEHGHITPAPIGELGARWFDEVYEEWFRPEQWMRLNLAGFVIRRDVHSAVGGHDHRYGLFAAPLLSARLDERGSRVGHLPDAEILHIQCDEIEEHHGHSADYVIGECEARTTLPPVFAEHYFGYRPLIWNRRAMETRSARHSAALLVRELIRSVSRRRSDARWLLNSLAGRLPEAIAGIGPRRRLAALAFRWSELTAKSRWIPRGRRYRAYLRAQDRVTELAQLRWIEEGTEGAPQGLGPGPHLVESIGEGTMVGLHGLELHSHRRFRWSEPVLTLRVSSPDGPLRIDTGRLRGSPLSCVTAAFLGSRRLRDDELRDEGGVLVIPLSGGEAELTLICRPLTTDSDEHRMLGLPIFSVDLGGPSSLSEPAAARKPAAVA